MPQDTEPSDHEPALVMRDADTSSRPRTAEP